MAKVKKPKVGDLLQINWYDHFLTSETWLDVKEDRVDERLLVSSYGVLVKEEPLYYTLASSYTTTVLGNGTVLGERKYGDVNRILKAGVYAIRRIEVL